MGPSINTPPFALTTGTVILWPTFRSKVPNGFLQCDGSSYNIVDYPALFSALSIKDSCIVEMDDTTISGLSATWEYFHGLTFFIGTQGMMLETIIDDHTITYSGIGPLPYGPQTIYFCPWGADGTVFNVPDFGDRFPVGAAAGIKEVGTFGGAWNVIFSGTTDISNNVTNVLTAGTAASGRNHRHTMTVHADVTNQYSTTYFIIKT